MKLHQCKHIGNELNPQASLPVSNVLIVQALGVNWMILMLFLKVFAQNIYLDPVLKSFLLEQSLCFSFAMLHGIFLFEPGRILVLRVPSGNAQIPSTRRIRFPVCRDVRCALPFWWFPEPVCARTATAALSAVPMAPLPESHGPQIQGTSASVSTSCSCSWFALPLLRDKVWRGASMGWWKTAALQLCHTSPHLGDVGKDRA